MMNKKGLKAKGRTVNTSKLKTSSFVMHTLKVKKFNASHRREVFATSLTAKD